MNINLKIEILKVFSLEFNLSSEKEKRKEPSAKESSDSKSAASK